MTDLGSRATMTDTATALAKDRLQAPEPHHPLWMAPSPPVHQSMITMQLGCN